MLIIPVADDETLYRRVPRIEGLYVIQADGTVKVSSAAFSDRSFRPSVDRAKLCHNDPRKTQRELSDGVVSVVTLDVRAIDTVVQNDKEGYTQNTPHAVSQATQGKRLVDASYVHYQVTFPFIHGSTDRI